MSFSPASPVTGAPGTGLTSPTYTLVVDTPPSSNGKQWAVSALGGTQTNVVVSSVSRPFTLSVFRPAVLKQLPPVNPVTGALPSVGRNVFKVITRKGVIPLAGQSSVNMLVETTISIPAGADIADFPNIAAAMSLHIGSLWEQSNELGDTLASGIL